MPCYHPIAAFQHNKTGEVRFSLPLGLGFINWNPLSLPCGKCIGCRLEHSRKWATRCVLEASMHQRNCFVTLTYNEENLPENKSLQKQDLTLFIKRLRKKFGEGIRYFACGEYGDLNLRPHYHIILFGFSPPDYEPVNKGLNPLCQNSCLPLSFLEYFTSSVESFGSSLIDSTESNAVYKTSQIITDLWQKGITSIGDVSFESCAYVARYCLKKINGKQAKEHYQDRIPEYVVMSRRPGIAKPWFDKYGHDVYPADVVLSRGHVTKPPRYFDNLLKSQDELLYNDIKEKRRVYASQNEENSPERLAVKEELININMKKISRKL